MRPVKLPGRPSGWVSGVIRRAVIIGNGFSGAESQCLGLVRALGLSSRFSLYRATRPSGGINKWLHWLPGSIHRRVDSLIRSIHDDYWRYGGNANDQMGMPSSTERTGILWENYNTFSDLELKRFDNLNGNVVGLADAKQIATLARDTFNKDGPLLVVASGRDTISVSSSIKRLAPDYVFVVQIQHPRSRLNRFDLVITPHHDYYPLTPHAQEQVPWFLRRWITPREPPDRRVVLTVGALPQADSAALRSAASVWHDELALLPKPLLVINIGGPTGNCEYGIDLAEQLKDKLQKVLWSCGSVRISFSRRTPEKVSNILVKEFSNNPKVYIWDGPNPHMGHLAWADAFVITADSVSMLSEACSTGIPVYVIGAERCTWKFADFQKRLHDRGVVRPFTGEEDISKVWSYPPLNDTAEAASQVINALAERGWTVQAVEDDVFFKL
ncbi:mitochondrial fission protein ELM1 isoform X2 [Hevea brasiliensis]|uniref:mitochondrial fission protein ELM1 isoform X2 n=1 Tax=Hevea brasiliensis TaxID=3981 RepID=UPI0025D1F8C7|nr:mitochondrial fission protein ELM1 isoform X2 [Hevea brasiliensis]